MKSIIQVVFSILMLSVFATNLLLEVVLAEQNACIELADLCEKEQGNKDGKKNGEAKDSKEEKDNNEAKDSKEEKDNNEAKDSKEEKDNNEAKDSKEEKDNNEAKDSKEEKDNNEAKDSKEVYNKFIESSIRLIGAMQQMHLQKTQNATHYADELQDYALELDTPPPEQGC